MLALFVNRCGKIVDEACPAFVFCGKQSQNLHIGGLGLGIALEFVTGMADNDPGRLEDLLVCTREDLDELARGSERLLVILHVVQVICGRPKDDRRLLVFRVGLSKFE